MVIFVFALGKTGLVGRPLLILKKAKTTEWGLDEFLKLKPSRYDRKEYYQFTEESVRSHAHRYVGRFDAAVLHWEEGPILDLLIERKFPSSILPDAAKEEDIFQAGLYALALLESGMSCSSTRLVIIYCLQNRAKRCSNSKSQRDCWLCCDGKVFYQKFQPDKVQKKLRTLDEVWYNKRQPKASPNQYKCMTCPFSGQGVCNYSAV